MHEPVSNPDALVGSTLDGRYRIDAFVDRGGMGRVYRATQLGLDRPVAIKVLDPEGKTGDANVFRRRFFMEAASTAQLTHPNTVRVFDYGSTTDGSPYLAMEFLDGQTLDDALKAGAVSPLVLLDAIRQACASLAEAHAAGLVHRDIKPSNLFLVPQRDGGILVKVVDFGLVKQMEADVGITRSGALLGSPLYMSPEQIAGEPIDGRTDIYSLGAVLFQGLTGRPPFEGTAITAVLVAHINQAPPPVSEAAPDAGLPRSIDWLVATCLAKQPNDRFATVDELSRALALCEAELEGRTGPLDLTLADGQLVVPEGLELPRLTAAPAVRRVAVAGGHRRRVRLAIAVLTLAALFSVVGLAAVAWQRDLQTAEATSPTPGVSVAVTVTPDNATIDLDGVFVGQGTATISVPAGERVEIHLTAPGYAAERIVLDGLLQDVHLELVPRHAMWPGATPPPQPAPSTPGAGPVPASPTPRELRRPPGSPPGPKVRPPRR